MAVSTDFEWIKQKSGLFGRSSQQLLVFKVDQITTPADRLEVALVVRQAFGFETKPNLIAIDGISYGVGPDFRELLVSVVYDQLNLSQNVPAFGQLIVEAQHEPERSNYFGTQQNQGSLDKQGHYSNEPILERLIQLLRSVPDEDQQVVLDAFADSYARYSSLTNCAQQQKPEIRELVLRNLETAPEDFLARLKDTYHWQIPDDVVDRITPVFKIRDDDSHRRFTSIEQATAYLAEHYQGSPEIVEKYRSAWANSHYEAHHWDGTKIAIVSRRRGGDPSEAQYSVVAPLNDPEEQQAVEFTETTAQDHGDDRHSATMQPATIA